MSAPAEYGPALYRIAYDNGSVGHERTLRNAIAYLTKYGRGSGAVRVEPVAGTEYRATYGGLVGGWYRFDAETLRHYAAGCRPLTALELRSPVQS